MDQLTAKVSEWLENTLQYKVGESSHHCGSLEEKPSQAVQPNVNRWSYSTPDSPQTDCEPDPLWGLDCNLLMWLVLRAPLQDRLPWRHFECMSDPSLHSLLYICSLEECRGFRANMWITSANFQITQPGGGSFSSSHKREQLFSNFHEIVFFLFFLPIALTEIVWACSHPRLFVKQKAAHHSSSLCM